MLVWLQLSEHPLALIHSSSSDVLKKSSLAAVLPCEERERLRILAEASLQLWSALVSLCFAIDTLSYSCHTILKVFSFGKAEITERTICTICMHIVRARNMHILPSTRAVLPSFKLTRWVPQAHFCLNAASGHQAVLLFVQ